MADTETEVVTGPGTPSAVSSPVLEVRNVVKEFRLGRSIFASRRPTLQAVNDISFSLQAGQTLGVVGESGCGKSTLAKMTLGLEVPTSGSISIKGRPLDSVSRSWRSSVIQLVMQDPYSSLNPRMTVYDIVAEAFVAHPELAERGRRRELVVEMLGLVGLGPHHLNKFPHQLSGGQRQRVGIARALAPRPSIVVCDEPVSALDVSVQAQVINLLESLQDTLGLAYVFISHDLSIVRHVSDRIAVIYLGRIVEEGPADAVYDAPAHPYTQALLASVAAPQVDADGKVVARPERIRGELPDPLNPPSGCAFRSRCFKAQDVCAQLSPELLPIDSAGHQARCHFPDVAQEPTLLPLPTVSRPDTN